MSNIKTKLLKSWKFWILIFTLAMVGFFFIMENQSNKMQPAEGWSIAINAIEGAPKDFRMIDIVARPDGEGILVSYLSKDGIEIYELDWFGKLDRHLLIEEDVSSIKLLDVGFNDSKYFIYLSDRVRLEKYDLDIESFEYSEKELISNNSEQFSAVGEAIIVGDDDLTEIIYQGEVLESVTGYDDLKRAHITLGEGKVIAGMDTVKGSRLVIIDGESSNTVQLISPQDENMLGYIGDVYIKDGIITVLSSKFHFGEDFPTSFGMWQIDKNAQIINEEFWYHNRTSSRPVITNVDGENISYVLGVLTRQDENKEAILKQPRLQDGAFTNLLEFHRRGSELTDYDRLTTTREYPIGYEYIKGKDGELIVWADRVGDNSNIKLAGKGEEWVNHARKVYEIDYTQVGSEILMSFVASLVWGIIFSALDLVSYLVPIIVFLVIILIFTRRTNLEDEKKDLVLFIIVALAVICFKFYTSAISNENLRAYGHIYPFVLGNDLVLGAISIITSMCSLFLIRLWHKSNKDLSATAHIFMFIGLEVYFYLLGIMVYVVSAMSKAAVMI